MKPILSTKDLETVIQALISTRSDYCNALYLGLRDSLVTHLGVQNAAVILLKGRLTVFFEA